MKILLKTFNSPNRGRRDLDKGREGSASVDDCAAEPLLLDPAPGDQDHQDHQDHQEQEQEGSDDDDDGDRSDDDDYVDDKEG